MNSEANCASMQCEICFAQFNVAHFDVHILGQRFPMYGPHASDGGMLCVAWFQCAVVNIKCVMQI